MKPAGRRLASGALALVAGLALAWWVWHRPGADEPLLAGRRIGEFFPRWEKPGVVVERIAFPDATDPDAAMRGLLWILQREDEAWLSYYRSFYLRAPVGFRSWLAWPRPARERQAQAFEALQTLAERPWVAQHLCGRLGDVAPDWLPEMAAMLSRRGLEAQVVLMLEGLAASSDSQLRNAALAALEQHRKPGGLIAAPSAPNGSGEPDLL